MTYRALMYAVFVCAQVRCWPFSIEAHGSREWFRNAEQILRLDPNKTRLYTSGVIVAEIGYNETHAMTTCRFTELRNEMERVYLYEKLGREPEAVDFHKMTAMIEDCGNSMASKRTFPRFSNPLFPGTLWCGPGDSAADYESLGVCAEPDACCRNHDLCPIRALAGETFTPRGRNRVTISDCRCDYALKNCLERSAKRNNNINSRVLGVLFGLGIGYCMAENGEVIKADFRGLDLMR